jgi:hypothetical protein
MESDGEQKRAPSKYRLSDRYLAARAEHDHVAAGVFGISNGAWSRVASARSPSGATSGAVSRRMVRSFAQLHATNARFLHPVSQPCASQQSSIAMQQIALYLHISSY